MYNVIIKQCVITFLKKIPRNESNYFRKKFIQISNNPNVGKFIDKHKTTILRELKYKSHRIYYTIENNLIVINDIESDGTILICQSGNKNTQRKDINKLKIKIRR